MFQNKDYTLFTSGFSDLVVGNPSKLPRKINFKQHIARDQELTKHWII